jgi:hypothetical protein
MDEHGFLTPTSTHKAEERKENWHIFREPSDEDSDDDKIVVMGMADRIRLWQTKYGRLLPSRTNQAASD